MDSLHSLDFNIGGGGPICHACRCPLRIRTERKPNIGTHLAFLLCCAIGYVLKRNTLNRGVEIHYIVVLFLFSVYFFVLHSSTAPIHVSDRRNIAHNVVHQFNL